MNTTKLETSKKLQAAGVRVGSYWSWNRCPAGIVVGVTSERWNDFPAYTFDDLAPLMPWFMSPGKVTCEISRDEFNGRWAIYVMMNNSCKHYIYADTLAEAAGLSLLWMIENKYVEVGA